jgi:hypothetical protein
MEFPYEEIVMGYLKMRLAEAESVGYGFDLPKVVVAPNAPKKNQKTEMEIAAKVAERSRVKIWWT